MTEQVHSDSVFRDEFLLGAAKAFFVTAYADWVEDLDYPRPGGGEDWMDFAPHPPPNAYALAGQLWEALEGLNEKSLYNIHHSAIAAGAGFDADNFGHCLAMEAMGTGVSWWDDHEEFPLEVPHMHVTMFSFDPAAYHLPKD